MERNGSEYFEVLDWDDKDNSLPHRQTNDGDQEVEPANELHDESKLLLASVSDLLRTIEICVQQRTLRSRQPTDTTQSYEERVRQFETGLIIEALVQTGGHQRRAAEILGLKNTTLNEKMRRLEIPSPKPGRPKSNKSLE